MRLLIVIVGILLISSVSALNPLEITCDKVFFMIVETNDNYQPSDLVEASESLTTITVSPDMIKEFADNYDLLCSSIRELPFARTRNILSPLGGIPPEIPDCDLEAPYSFFNYSFPVFEIIDKPFELHIAPEGMCEKAERWNWWLGLEQQDASFSVTGFKIWYFFSFISLLIVYLTIKALYNLNKNKE